MPKYCAVPKCTTNGGFKFPKDPQLKRQWQVAVKRVEPGPEKKYWEPGGQRMITALIYLNDVKDGGATYFPELNISINPKKGNVLIFHNTISETTNINPRSLHAGMPVSSGEKWAANLWFRENLRY